MAFSDTATIHLLTQLEGCGLCAAIVDLNKGGVACVLLLVISTRGVWPVCFYSLSQRGGRGLCADLVDLNEAGVACVLL